MVVLLATLDDRSVPVVPSVSAATSGDRAGAIRSPGGDLDELAGVKRAGAGVPGGADQKPAQVRHSWRAPWRRRRWLLAQATGADHGCGRLIQWSSRTSVALRRPDSKVCVGAVPVMVAAAAPHHACQCSRLLAGLAGPVLPVAPVLPLGTTRFSVWVGRRAGDRCRCGAFWADRADARVLAGRWRHRSDQLGGTCGPDGTRGPTEPVSATVPQRVGCHCR